MWGFTIDDAFIPLRYAAQLRRFGAYRFCEGSAPSDGVTPLPLPFLLVPFGGAPPFAALVTWKALSLVLCVCVAVYASRSLKGDAASRLLLGALLVGPLPVAAHAGAGLETGLVIALGTIAASMFSVRPTRALVFAGLASAFRPELIVFSISMTLAVAFRDREAARVPRTVATWASASLLPFLVCAGARAAAFGAPIPLSAYAKPASLSQGSVYVLVACLVCATPILGLVSLSRRGTPRLLSLVGFAGCCAIAMAGGDWMPYGRLVAPLAPVFVFAFSEAEFQGYKGKLPALLVGLLSAWPWVTAAPRGRTVLADRAALVLDAQPLLGDRIASVDIGWPSATKPDAYIMDLAGLTDAQIAHLRGSHTSKNVDAGMLLDRHIDTVLLYASTGSSDVPYDGAVYGRETDYRLAQSELLHAHFEQRAFVRLGRSGSSGYYILRRR